MFSKKDLQKTIACCRCVDCFTEIRICHMQLANPQKNPRANAKQSLFPVVSATGQTRSKPAAKYLRFIRRRRLRGFQLSENTGGPLSGRILVVDDLNDAAASLALVCELYGAQARVARDGLEALR